MAWFLFAGQKSLGVRVSVEHSLVLGSMVEINVISSWGIKLDLISLQGSELTRFWCGFRKWFGSGLWIKRKIFSVWGCKLTCFFVRESQLPWFLWGGRKWFRFSVWVENGFVYVGDRTWHDFSVGIGKRLGFIQYGGPNTLGFSVRIEIIMALVSRDQNCFFYRGNRKWLDLSVGIGIDLIFAWGSQNSWF